MRCSFPEICKWYLESESSNTAKRPICLLHDIIINYTNITKIENCQDHQTLKQNKDKWKNNPC